MDWVIGEGQSVDCHVDMELGDLWRRRLVSTSQPQ